MCVYTRPLNERDDWGAVHVDDCTLRPVMDAGSMSLLASMGFAHGLSAAALAQAGNDVNQALELILTQQVVMSEAAAAAPARSSPTT
eukprot:COSAG02_NODE_50689_length_319_cov_0.577273_1_plen_86_part_01